MPATRVVRKPVVKEGKKEVIKLPPLVSCTGCIYFVDFKKSVMYCEKIKMPTSIKNKHCIFKKEV